MAKITYLLGAGSSYYSCPILENQAEMMINVAGIEIGNIVNVHNNNNYKKYDFINKNYLDNFDLNEYKICWWIGYFGEKAREFNTIDTYARKLYLNNEIDEYNKLKMCVSVFFDLWENFYHYRFTLKDENPFNKIDNRYKSLFSVLLDVEDKKIRLNNDFKFITWNYDLQLEETFKLFLNDYSLTDLDELNSNNFKFKNDNNTNNNDVFHLNGLRGFYKIGNKENEKDLLLKNSLVYNDYWENHKNLYNDLISGKIKFENNIKYAWEHKLDDDFFKNISKVLNGTEILIIIGYSFPAFNRKIDQFLFKHLNCNVLKKIIYQDPNADKEMIINLFEDIYCYEEVDIKILTDEKSLKQFYLPNEHFLIQNNVPYGVDPKVF